MAAKCSSDAKCLTDDRVVSRALSQIRPLYSCGLHLAWWAVGARFKPHMVGTNSFLASVFCFSLVIMVPLECYPFSALSLCLEWYGLILTDIKLLPFGPYRLVVRSSCCGNADPRRPRFESWYGHLWSTFLLFVGKTTRNRPLN